MSLGKILFLVFLAVPVLEIYLLIQVGGLVGAVWTVFLVVLTAVLGASLVRIQGLSTLHRVQQSLNEGQVPALDMLEGVFLLIAGALLLTPGFFTDAVGFACLTPALRRGVIRWALSKGLLNTGASHPADSPGPGAKQTLDGEFRKLDE